MAKTTTKIFGRIVDGSKLRTIGQLRAAIGNYDGGLQVVQRPDGSYAFIDPRRTAVIDDPSRWPRAYRPGDKPGHHRRHTPFPPARRC
jgi:hypothetical protein